MVALATDQPSRITLPKKKTKNTHHHDLIILKLPLLSLLYRPKKKDKLTPVSPIPKAIRLHHANILPRHSKPVNCILRPRLTVLSSYTGEWGDSWFIGRENMKQPAQPHIQLLGRCGWTAIVESKLQRLIVSWSHHWSNIPTNHPHALISHWQQTWACPVSSSACRKSCWRRLRKDW